MPPKQSLCFSQHSLWIFECVHTSVVESSDQNKLAIFAACWEACRVCVLVLRHRSEATYHAVLSGQIVSGSLWSPDRWWKLISCLYSHSSERPHPWLSFLRNCSVCVTLGFIWGCASGPVSRKGCAVKPFRPTKSSVVPLSCCLPH